MTYNQILTQESSENKPQIHLQNQPKLKRDQTFYGSNEIKAILNDEEGAQIFLEILGRIVAAATIGDYLVNLDL